MKFVVSIYRDEDGVYIGECPPFRAASAKANRGRGRVEDRRCIRECLAVRAELGMPLTVTAREVEVAV